MTSHTSNTTNVNVTGAGMGSGTVRRTFPCPLCADALELRKSRANKPYSVCDSCGIQIFFRGKVAISRLQAFVDSTQSVVAPRAPAAPAVTLFSRLEQLRTNRSELEKKRPLIFGDQALENAISAIECEITQTQDALNALAHAR